MFHIQQLPEQSPCSPYDRDDLQRESVHPQLPCFWHPTQRYSLITLQLSHSWEYVSHYTGDQLEQSLTYEWTTIRKHRTFLTN